MLHKTIQNTHYTD